MSTTKNKAKNLFINFVLFLIFHYVTTYGLRKRSPLQRARETRPYPQQVFKKRSDTTYPRENLHIVILSSQNMLASITYVPGTTSKLFQKIGGRYGWFFVGFLSHFLS